MIFFKRVYVLKELVKNCNNILVEIQRIYMSEDFKSVRLG